MWVNQSEMKKPNSFSLDKGKFRVYVSRFILISVIFIFTTYYLVSVQKKSSLRWLNEILRKIHGFVLQRITQNSFFYWSLQRCCASQVSLEEITTKVKTNNTYLMLSLKFSSHHLNSRLMARFSLCDQNWHNSLRRRLKLTLSQGSKVITNLSIIFIYAASTFSSVSFFFVPQSILLFDFFKESFVVLLREDLLLLATAVDDCTRNLRDASRPWYTPALITLPTCNDKFSL